MSLHLLYFHLAGAARFGGIHGGEFSRTAARDLTRRFWALSRVVLHQHDMLSAPVVPAPGIWAVPFGTKRLEIAADEREQLESIAAAAAELGRDAVLSELGAAVALHAGLSVGTFDVDAKQGSAEWMRSLRAFLRGAGPARPDASAEEREAFRRIVASGLEPHLQEIVDLEAGRVEAYECLIRGPQGALRRPDRLFAEAARCGLRKELELASLDAALKLVPRLAQPLRMAVNLSPDLFSERLVRRIAEEPALARRLILEITEHLPIRDPARLVRDLAPLRRRGVKLALDDAGCGYLNMKLVRLLEPDIVKLCISVTRRLGRGPRMLEAVRRSVASIRAAGADVLAEGVETRGQARLARACGCVLAQGWLFGRPRPAATALADASSLGRAEKVTVPP